jgi:hypothetical protein
VEDWLTIAPPPPLGHLLVDRTRAQQRAVEVHAHELLVVVPVDGERSSFMPPKIAALLTR